MRAALPAHWRRHLPLGGRGASAAAVERGGRWESDAYKGYVRFHEMDAQVVSDTLADADAHPAV